MYRAFKGFKEEFKEKFGEILSAGLVQPEEEATLYTQWLEFRLRVALHEVELYKRAADVAIESRLDLLIGHAKKR